MKRFWVVPAGVVSALLVMMAPVNLGPRAHVAFIAAILVLSGIACVAIIYWILTIAELLQMGPGPHLHWWLGALAVVVVLGPFGALAYHLAQPTFADANTQPLSETGRQH